MKKVLIIGKQSYIGESFAVFADDRYCIETVSSIDGAWRDSDFSGFDSILHCAGIAHVSRDAKDEAMYYLVNSDLAVAVAKKAKAEGVGQFIFLSSMLVYGSANEEIDEKTHPNPDDFYGGSKLQAEKELQKLADDSFKLCVVRPPMVYGPNSKGNFPRLVKLARKTPLFPNFQNKRSMIYIENLCSFFCNLIDSENHGIFKPQNSEYISTIGLVKCIAKQSGKRIRTTKTFNPLIKLLTRRVGTFQKMFSNLTYTHNGDEDSYNVVNFEESVRRSLLNAECRMQNAELGEHLNHPQTYNSPLSSLLSPLPSVSIITTTFNSEKTLKDTLESVLHQTLPPTEYIIVDGNSTDGTPALAESYREAFEKKGVSFKITSEPDKGVYDAMNKGILSSSGDIIGMINSDDWYEPHAIERAAQTYQNTCYDMMFADIMIYKGDKPIRKKSKLGKWVTSRNWNHPTTFTHKDIYKDNLFPLHSVYDDFNLYLKLRKEKKNIVVVNEVLANYRLGGISNQKGISAALNRAKLRYSIYRSNGYSRIYLLECVLIEGAKFLLTR